MLYHGTHTSLYKSLPPALIPILENCILKAKVNLYAAAEEIFNNELSAYSHIPIVALEHAELLIHRYKFLSIPEVLNKVPESAFTDNKEDRQVRQWIAMIRAVVKVVTEATSEPAMTELKNLRREWATKSVDEFSDIEVEIVRKYVVICTLIAASSNFITEDFHFFPVSSPSNGSPVAWQSLTDLRVSLISQSRFMEAFRFSSVERSMVTRPEEYHVTTLLLKLAKDQRQRVIGTRDELAWTAAMVQLKLGLGKLFSNAGARAEAEVWLSSVENDVDELVTKINDNTGSLSAGDSYAMMVIEYCRLKMLQNEEITKVRFQQLLKLGERMSEVGGSETRNCYDLALDWARRFYSGEEYTIICTDIHFRNQHLFENVQGLLPMAVNNLRIILAPGAQIVTEAAKNIEIMEAFMSRHPELLLPMVLPGVKYQLRIRDVLYSQLQELRPLQIDYQSTETRDMYSSIPTSGIFRRETSKLEVDEDTIRVKHVFDKENAESIQFNMICGYFTKPAEIRAPTVLHKLLVEESASGILSNHAMAQIFGVIGTNQIGAAEELHDLNQDEILPKLLGTTESPIRGAEWIKRRNSLGNWLLDASRPDFSIRQCLWIDIHDLRRDVWSSRLLEDWFDRQFRSTHKVNPTDSIQSLSLYADERREEILEHISAIKERLSLEEAKTDFTSERYEKDNFTTGFMIPQLFIDFFFYSYLVPKEVNEVSIAALEQAEDVAHKQLTYWRRVKNYQIMAYCAINIAKITEYRIDTGIIKESAAINQAAEEALKILEEVDSIFGTTLYEIDIKHSPISLETKINVGSRIRIWTIGQTAVLLLFHTIRAMGDETGYYNNPELKASYEEKLLRLWQWVQRTKARTLAQSMGLDSMVPDTILAGIQGALNDERAKATSSLLAARDKTDGGSIRELHQALDALLLEEECSPDMSLLGEVRRILKQIKASDRVTTNFHDILPGSSSKEFLKSVGSMITDINLVETIKKKIKDMNEIEGESKETLQEALSKVNERIAVKPALAKLVSIADTLNREEVLLKRIEDSPEGNRYQYRVELQSLRKEMREEPVLYRMLRIREGWPLSSEELNQIANARDGKITFVDWFAVWSVFHPTKKIYMIIWRNGVCKLIPLETEYKRHREETRSFHDFRNRDIYLPQVDLTPLEEMDWEIFIPKIKDVKGDIEPVEGCLELVKPLFDNPLIQPGDLLVLSVTEGFQNFPLHAIEDSKQRTLILHHPVVYIPSLSVLHQCFWSRYVSNTIPAETNKNLRSLILGGVDSKLDAFQYGGKAVQKIGTVLNTPNVFIGPEATLSNFRQMIPTSDLVHIHLHSNFILPDGSASASTSTAPEDSAFTTSPRNQAIVFNSSTSDGSNELSADSILTLPLSRGAHVNLVACASGQQGKLHNASSSKLSQWILHNDITDEVMGLVPAFLLAGAGSITSTLWPIEDEHGAVFSCLLFKEIHSSRAQKKGDWVDLAEAHRKAVLEMKRIYKQPSAWAGFVLSGYWQFRA